MLRNHNSDFVVALHRHKPMHAMFGVAPPQANKNHDTKKHNAALRMPMAAATGQTIKTRGLSAFIGALQADNGNTSSATVCGVDEAVTVLSNDSILDAPIFSLKGVHAWARLLDVYDGDTVWVAIPLAGNGPVRVKLRLRGIDTPEIRSACANERSAAVLARDALVLHLRPDANTPPATKGGLRDSLAKQPCVVYVECHDNDKYGRVLADVYNSVTGPCGESAATHLIRIGMAKPYSGRGPRDTSIPVSG